VRLKVHMRTWTGFRGAIGSMRKRALYEVK